MFAVVFQVHPAEGKKEEYLELAKHLKPILESIDGFIDNERFESKRRQGWVLSLSTWRDEKAVVRWRSQGEHHRIQGVGRDHVFSGLSSECLRGDIGQSASARNEGSRAAIGSDRHRSGEGPRDYRIDAG